MLNASVRAALRSRCTPALVTRICLSQARAAVRSIASLPMKCTTSFRGIEAKGHYETARRLRAPAGRCSAMPFATAISERDVCADLRGALITPKVKHLAAITKPSGVGVFCRMCAIDGFDRLPRDPRRFAAGTLHLPCTSRRTTPCRVVGDRLLNNGSGAISADKMKMRRPHYVPLSRQALGIIEEIRPVTGRHRYLFPCQGKRDRPSGR